MLGGLGVPARVTDLCDCSRYSCSHTRSNKSLSKGGRFYLCSLEHILIHLVSFGLGARPNPPPRTPKTRPGSPKDPSQDRLEIASGRSGPPNGLLLLTSENGLKSGVSKVKSKSR
jgi:hypothetical protein